jgi:hypothetical protein
LPFLDLLPKLWNGWKEEKRQLEEILPAQGGKESYGDLIL